MASQIPITLKGKNLGQRHRLLNSLVLDSFHHDECFEDIVALPESSPVDRLFKIDLASKHKNVEYILKNLRDDDMLYVSRALRQSKWLLSEEYRQIIDPAYLEDTLYPEMITTAVNKMKRWTYLYLNDPKRCQLFFEYYREKDFNYAFKLLCKCPKEIILNEFPTKETLATITPHHFKILCEKTSALPRTFFKILNGDSMLLQKYNKSDFKFFNSLKCILKINVDMFLDIVEEHFMTNFKRLSKKSTKFIMTYRKDRVMLKPELYTSRVLNVAVLAQCLTENECEDLVIKLARARYLQDKENWFNYKNIEEVVKRMDVNKRADLKKKVFVHKDFGEVVTDWPYPVPKLLLVNEAKNESDVFLDKVDSYDKYSCDKRRDRYLKCDWHSQKSKSNNRRTKTKPRSQPRSPLDVLFDEYRFESFDKTLLELCKKIKSESVPQNRMFMMLVLVSKSGGQVDNLEALAKFLMNHRNEPSHVRAAVIRSLVKRACVWRVTEDIWKNVLIFGRGLGLDGDTPQADCDEGLHAVIIRKLLAGHTLDLAVTKSYIKKFSPLTIYSLTGIEQELIKNMLLNMLLKCANAQTNTVLVAHIIKLALHTIQAHNIKFETHPEIITSIKNLVQNDRNAAKDVLNILYKSKWGRKEFFKDNFYFIQTDASYVNALKHDIEVLSVDRYLVATYCNSLMAEQFLRKISIYFNEKEGLASRFLTSMKNEQSLEFARPLAYLTGIDLKSYILELDSDSNYKELSAKMRANAHLARPALNIDSLGWRRSGAKLIANKVLKCRSIEINYFINQLLSWKRTARLALILAQRTNYEHEVIERVAKIKPTTALKSILLYFQRKDHFDLQIWKIVKPLFLENKNSIKVNDRLVRNMCRVASVPVCIRHEYATELFKVVNDMDLNKSMSVLWHIMLVLPKIEEDFIEAVLKDFFQIHLSVEDNLNHYRSGERVTLLSNILGKYLLLAKSEESQIKRFQNVGQIYLDFLQSCWESEENKTMFFNHLNAVIRSFKYNEVFINEDYVCCLPIMKRFLEWMKTILPMVKYFDTYVPLHLTILYYKAIQKTAKEMPGVLMNEEWRRNEGYMVVGEIFGKYIGKEIEILVKSYFDSIVVLYGQSLVQFTSDFNKGKFRMIPYIIKGIIARCHGIECRIALDLYYYCCRYLDDGELKDITKCLREKKLTVLQLCFSGWPLSTRMHI